MTDDLPALIPKRNSDEEWFKEYEVYTKFLLRWDSLMNPIGLRRHIGKGEIYLPPKAPDPPDGSPLHYLTKVKRDGVTLGGAFIGRPEAVANAAMEKVKDLEKRATALLKLASPNPHVAYRLTGTALNAAMDYLIRCTAPELIMDALVAFDDLIRRTTDTCLELQGFDPPKCDPTRYTRADHRRQLPFSFGGAGQTTTVSKAP